MSTSQSRIATASTSHSPTPHHRLGERSLESIRDFYRDPSEIGWLAHPIPDALSFVAELSLNHSKARSEGRGKWGTPDFYRADGKLTLSRTLTFLGRSATTGRREVCTVILGCDCPQYLAPLLQRHSQQLLNTSVMESRRAPASVTSHFAGAFEGMLGRILKEMVSYTASQGGSGFVPERPDVDDSKFWSLVTVEAQATAHVMDKQGYLTPDIFTATINFKVYVEAETDSD